MVYQCPVRPVLVLSCWKNKLHHTIKDPTPTAMRHAARRIVFADPGCDNFYLVVHWILRSRLVKHPGGPQCNVVTSSRAVTCAEARSMMAEGALEQYIDVPHIGSLTDTSTMLRLDPSTPLCLQKRVKFCSAGSHAAD